MASPPPPPSSRPPQYISCRFLLLLLLLLVLLLHGPCDGYHVRSGAPAAAGHRRQKFPTSFVSWGRTFNFLPRGTPIPPSGPSKGHNSELDSNIGGEHKPSP